MNPEGKREVSQSSEYAFEEMEQLACRMKKISVEEGEQENTPGEFFGPQALNEVFQSFSGPEIRLSPEEEEIEWARVMSLEFPDFFGVWGQVESAPRVRLRGETQASSFSNLLTKAFYAPVGSIKRNVIDFKIRKTALFHLSKWRLIGQSPV
jgi:hypothetical protein